MVHQRNRRLLESLTRDYSLVPLTHHDPKDLELIYLERERKKTILDFLKEIHPLLKDRRRAEIFSEKPILVVQV